MSNPDNPYLKATENYSYNLLSLATYMLSNPRNFIFNEQPLATPNMRNTWQPFLLTIYAPMIYKASCIMFWMRAYPLRGEVGGGWALEFESFLGPVKWHQAETLCTGLYKS
jgi:hypothetical protein